MRKVHITLVGREAAPVYNVISALSPAHIVYIYSDSIDSINALTALKNEINISSEEEKFPLTDPEEIKGKVLEIYNRFKNDEITVNISSGLKSWTYWFSIEAKSKDNVTIVYIDQNNFLWDYRTMKVVENKEFDMRTFFRLYGNSIDGNYINYNSYTEKDYKVTKEIVAIRKFNTNEFNIIATVLSKTNENILNSSKKGKFSSSLGSYVCWEKPLVPGEEGRVQICILRKNGLKLEKELASPHIIELLFNSGWFEYKVASLLSKWPKAKEIYLNCRFPFKPGVDKNEVDILVNTGSKVLFVECKTQIKNTVDIDKFRSVVKKYGGMGSKGLFITDAPMSDVAIQKCEDNALLHFSLSEQTLIPINQALYLLLDSELYNINAR